MRVSIPTLATAALGALLATAATGAQLSEPDLRLFLDEFFERELEPHEVVGAGVVVVHEGQVVGAGGYGYADLEEQRPVVADETIFPAQSVSKLFAATAVMQLFEQGRVDLDADLRDYLDGAPLDSDFTEPITLGHLLTHTAGFDDSYIGLLPRDPDDTLSVPEFLAEHRRRVIFRPGTVHAYSNYASLLARHAVNVVTGLTYEDYLLQEILRPLGMQESCALPAPPEWLDRFATGYLPGRDGLESTREAWPDGLVRFRTPTGTVASTVIDMARFMIAHLEGGVVEGSSILEPETLELMHRQQFAQHPRVPGATYGFFESTAGGRRGLFHFGSGFGYGTMLYLLPESRTGLYIAHSNSGAKIAEALLLEFLDRYFDSPEREVLIKPSTSSVHPEISGVDRLAGFYVPVRRAESTFEKLPLWLLQARFRVSGPDRLSNDQILPREWSRTESLVLERERGDGIVAFDENAAGEPTLASVWDEEMPQLLVLERVPWYDSTPALLARLGWFVLVLLTVIVGYPIATWIRRWRGRAPVSSAVRRATWWAAALDFSFLVGVAWIFVGRQSFYSVSPVMVAIFWLPLVAIVPKALAVVGAVRSQSDGDAGLRMRLVRIVVLFTLVLFTGFLWRWNLLGFYF